MSLNRPVRDGQRSAVLAFTVSTLLIALLLAGCGGGSSSVAQTPPVQTPPPTAAASFSVSSVSFSSQSMTTSSAPQTLTLTDTGAATLKVTSIAIGGTNQSDFSETNNCGMSVGASASCMISVKFTPTGTGTRTAMLTITDNAPGSPQSISLSGTAAPPIAVSVSPGTASVQVGATQTFTTTVQNDGSGGGVTWMLSGMGCGAAACGTLSSASSASGAQITYTAPASVPNPATVTLTAASVTDGTKSSAATITVTAAQPADLGAIQGPAPLIAVDVNNDIVIATVSAGNLVQLQRSVDAGKTFSRISTNLPGGANTPVGLQMGLDNRGNVTLFWELWQTAVIYVRVFTQSSGFGNLLPIGGAASCGLDPCTQDPGQYPQLSVTPGGVINVAFTGGVQADEVQSVHLVPPLSINGGVYSSCTASPNECAVIAANFNASNVTNVAGPQGQEYLFWNGGTPVSASGRGVSSVYSLDGGVTFPNINNPVLISTTDDSSTTTDTRPQAVVNSNGNIDVAWSNTVFPSNGSPSYHVMFSRSTDQGQTFSTPVVVLSRGEFFPVDQFTFIVEASGAIDFGIDVAPGAGGFLQFLRSRDNGATFSPPVQLTSSAVGRPAISSDSCGGINVAWDDVGGNIWLTRSTDGSTFSDPVNLTNNNGSGYPHMAGDAKGHTYVVWPQSLPDGTTHAFFVLAGTCAQ
jgi:centrosomal CEP192-like protein